VIASFHKTNRDKLGEVLRGGLVVVPGFLSMQSANDMEHIFLQESNFLYLCGINQPGWTLIHDGLTGTCTLVAPKLSDAMLIFNGGLTTTEALEISGADKVIDQDDAEGFLRQLARKHTVVYTIDQPSWIDHESVVLNPAQAKTRKMLERIFTSVQPCNKELSKLRAIKQPVEIAAIQKAVDITSRAFTAVHDKISSYSHEYQIEADFSHTFTYGGGYNHAYSPIVAAGKNACTLHYVKNNDRIKAKDLLLIDIGASVDGYAADITRTYAIGQISKRHQTVHQAVKDAQRKIVSLLEPNLTVERYQQHVDSYMIEALRTLDLVKSDEREALRKYMPHAISHGLGLDVHDSLGAPVYFEPGMVLTVEPGIYIPEESIGVRIEDDILITEKDHRNLSRKLPITW
jgi:Xaa-Pro aminopeptidase